jgi:hypothetical protein
MATEMHIQGYSDTEIADFMNNRPDAGYELSRQSVTRDRAKLLEQVQEEGKELAGQWLTEEITRLYVVEKEAWLAYRRSMDESKITKKIKSLLADNDGKVDKDSTLVITQIEELIQQNIGNPKWLQIILDCVEKRSRLRGLYKFQARIETDTEIRVKTYHSFSPAQWDLPGNPQQDRIVDGTARTRLPSGESHE